jgi:hypothetical protein
MKLPVLISGLFLSVALVGCAEQTPAANVAEETMAPASVAPTMASEEMPPIPASSVTLECASYSPDAQVFVRQEADLTVNGVQYRVATIGCGEANSELSAEVVESFVAEDGIWASNGLVSGTDVPFNTSGPCDSDNAVVRCPAYFVTEDVESTEEGYIEVSGYIEITGQDNGLVWTFVAEEEVAL